MKTESHKDYWDERGRLSYTYRGETFYTVTAIPYYWRRRQILLKQMQRFLRDPKAEKVCDFGCGDGWYLKYLSRTYPTKRWYGLDLSETMIARAKEECPTANLVTASDGIPFQTEFDLVYAIAVFAHVMDDHSVKSLFENIRTKLRPNGYFIIFEQVGPERRQGDWWCRRTSDEYVRIAEECGLLMEERTLITFSAHRFFERRIAPYFIRLFSNGSDYSERCINANRLLLYRALSSSAVAVSLHPVRSDNGKIYGNTIFVFRNAAQQ